ncbi:MAG: hypothetical protein ACRDYX_15415 [Egibacteraceae bacterium]
MRSDVTVKDRVGRPVVTVEVKARAEADVTWAAKFHRNLLAHATGTPSDFFLLVTPKETFLWKEASSPTGGERQPDVIVETRELLGEYFDELERIHGRVTGTAFEHLVGAWLSAIVSAPSLDELPTGTRSFAKASGLYDATQGGSVHFEAA